MRYGQEGNLATKAYQRAIPYELPEIVPNPEEIEALKRRKRQQLQQENAIRHQYKSVTHLRVKTTMRLLAVFLALASVIGFVVWRSAKVTEMSFFNAGLKRQINELVKQNSLLQDKISGKSSLQMVKDVATSQLGLQKAASDQIMYVPATILRSASNGDGSEISQDIQSIRLPAENMALIESWVRGR